MQGEQERELGEYERQESSTCSGRFQSPPPLFVPVRGPSVERSGPSPVSSLSHRLGLPRQRARGDPSQTGGGDACERKSGGGAAWLHSEKQARAESRRNVAATKGEHFAASSHASAWKSEWKGARSSGGRRSTRDSSSKCAAPPSRVRRRRLRTREDRLAADAVRLNLLRGRLPRWARRRSLQERTSGASKESGASRPVGVSAPSAGPFHCVLPAAAPLLVSALEEEAEKQQARAASRRASTLFPRARLPSSPPEVALIFKPPSPAACDL